MSLAVTPGRITGLIGANGAGKTTLIDAVTGFARLSAGHVDLGGTRLDRLPAHRRARLGLSRSFQSLELFDDLTVRDNLVTASDDHRWSSWLTGVLRPGRPTLSASAVAAVRELGLEADLDRKPPELPNGRRRLVAIARAIAASPGVLLLDEPAAGLDEAETAELGRLLTRLAHEWGFAILLVEHDVAMVMATSDTVVAIDFGKKIAEGTPQEVRRHPQVVQAYLGAQTVDPGQSVDPGPPAQPAQPAGVPR